MGHGTPTWLRLPLLPPIVVDRLPMLWWRPGNLHFLRRTGITWHFCTASNSAGVGVRTVEGGGRVLAWGHRQFDYDYLWPAEDPEGE
jgi:hypothetical protein